MRVQKDHPRGYGPCFDDYVVTRDATITFRSCEPDDPVVRQDYAATMCVDDAIVTTEQIGEVTEFGFFGGCARPRALVDALALEPNVSECGCFTARAASGNLEFVRECIAEARAQCRPAVYTVLIEPGRPEGPKSLLQHLAVVPEGSENCELRVYEGRGHEVEQTLCEDVAVESDISLAPANCTPI